MAKGRKHRYLGTGRQQMELPNLIEIQTKSFDWFLQAGVAPENRSHQGLEAVFQETFPITSDNDEIKLTYTHYILDDPKYDEVQARDMGKTYAVPLKAKIGLEFRETGEIREQEVYFGDFPLMTSRGTFIINGAERVVVSQIHRSPGVFFNFDDKKQLFSARLIPERGSWLEFELDIKGVLNVRIDRKRKFPVSMFLRALGYSSDEQILKLFYETKEIKIAKKPSPETKKKLTDDILGRRSARRILAMPESSDDEPMVICEAGEKISSDILEQIFTENIPVVEVMDDRQFKGSVSLFKALEKDETNDAKIGAKYGQVYYREIISELHTEFYQSKAEIITKSRVKKYLKDGLSQIKAREKAETELHDEIEQAVAEEIQNQLSEALTVMRTRVEAKQREEAIRKIHFILRPGEPVIVENYERDFRNQFFEEGRYDLGIVGRYKINKKFNYSTNVRTRALIEEDVKETIKYVMLLQVQEREPDDIDHLGNRRIRTVGELLVNQLKVGFTRMERVIRERLTIQDVQTITPQVLISIKSITAVVNEFFGSSQLSQFMDQTNPLAELTHKRRLNALGQGGLTRERAGYEVRDVHYSHYGRMCPIETPEGPNIGLIVSLSTFARLNEYGYITTPYRIVEKGVVSNKTVYLTADEEENVNIAQANVTLDEKGRFLDKLISMRNKSNYLFGSPEDVNYMDVSPKQLVSISTSLIPFLEHDDANRALMGSNMQRQAVPLLSADAPYVQTGIEGVAARNSGVCIIARNDGEVIDVTADKIIIKVDTSKAATKTESGLDYDVYTLDKFRRTNQGTCFTQKPIVNIGDTVKRGEIIADGPSVDHGELALGRNVLVAFMAWEGYNYEDSILISEEVVKGDYFTSIHIEEFDIDARETKLGQEIITRDIPNLSEEAFANLDEDGIIRIGAHVKSGDILVGKVTPKGEQDLTPEYKLLHSIFGEKAREVRDTSLRIPHGVEGVVIDVKIFRRESGAELQPGVEEMVKVYVAQKRKLQVGDKLAGRHGNKGVLSKILPVEDMPYLEDGTPVDIVLNPLGVPSRMNIGQILETQLGWAAEKLHETMITPIFEGASIHNIKSLCKEAGLPETGKATLYDGRTGMEFKNKITVGQIYMLKLNHLVDDKIHARSTGPYSLVTQQPLGGKAQFGGQRLGEMEVWAFEAYGAANTLQELLTVKSDDMVGRAKIYEAIVKGENAMAPGIPESFNVLIQELRGLCLDINVLNSKGQPVALYDDFGSDFQRPTTKKLSAESLFK